jgi:hypothetical protein
MKLKIARCAAVVTRRTQRVKSDRALTILRHAAVAEYVDYALFDE